VPHLAPAASEQITAVLDEFAAAWSERDLRRVADLWDPAEAAPTYVADELGEVLADRTAIADHLTRTENRLTTARVSVKLNAVTELAEDLILVVFCCRWELEWVSYTRVGAVLRRRGDRWRFVHYMEAPFHMEDWDDMQQR
jgi:hypothetical protein